MTTQTEKRDIREFTFPVYNEIPDVGLYLKQVVKYINETLSPWFDITVTETMLSNYVKMHMIPNAIKKQYYRDQITAMMFIVLAKTIVSLDNIQLLLKIREEKYEAKTAYEYFRACFMQTLSDMYGLDGTEYAAIMEDLAEKMNRYKEGAEEKTGAADPSPELTLLGNVIAAVLQKFHIDSSFRDLALSRELPET